MITFKIFHVNAFSSEDFKGNPAGVVPLDFWITDDLMQKIAKQNGLSETAFFVKTTQGFHIRWFTPETEVDLCGHATLASTYVLLELMGHPDKRIVFESASGNLEVYKEKGKYFLSLPAFTPLPISFDFNFQKALGVVPAEILNAGEDLLLIFNNEDEILQIKPDFGLISKIKTRGVIVSAKARDVDFVVRFFGPNVGINEDPVTGSAFTKLLPYWSEKLNKDTFEAIQLSERTGKIVGKLENDRVVIGGEALHYLSGEIFIKS